MCIVGLRRSRSGSSIGSRRALASLVALRICRHVCAVDVLHLGIRRYDRLCNGKYQAFPPAGVTHVGSPPQRGLEAAGSTRRPFLLSSTRPVHTGHHIQDITFRRTTEVSP